MADKTAFGPISIASWFVISMEAVPAVVCRAGASLADGPGRKN
jgi:hypothetical protein